MGEAANADHRSLADMRLAGEALILLTLAGLALRAMTFAQVASLAGRRRTAARPESNDNLARRIGWAVRAVANRCPWGPLCLERGLAAHLMLRLRGHDSTLYYGARNDGSLGPSAHVWVRVGAWDVVGCEEAERFATLATFPPGPARAD